MQTNVIFRNSKGKQQIIGIIRNKDEALDFVKYARTKTKDNIYLKPVKVITKYWSE